jgi:glycosyltransferase involved in cell wall biosynthesis
MLIGIDASRAFIKNKTGIEEYSYQVIKRLRHYIREQEVVLYLDTRINKKDYLNFKLPAGWKIKLLRTPFFFWTQARLSLEMLFKPVDVLFIPSHTVPIIHPKKSIVAVHGLEFEYCPQAYSSFERFYMRWVIKSSCRWAEKVIAVSENTKKDLIQLYKVPENKIRVIYEGVREINPNAKIPMPNKIPNPKSQIPNTKYFLFIGRLEERKNICGIIDVFEILKRKYNIPHKLILAGMFGHGKENIKDKISRSKYTEDIILPGYIGDEEKFELMKNADVFLFPSFYEGFGLPIIEAQSAGVPVVTSNISSMPEVAGNGAVLIDPKNIEEIAEAVQKLISDEGYKNDMIEKGRENVKRFSWDKCAKEIAEIILSTEQGTS